MLNSTVIFGFSFLYWKYYFWEKLVQKIKIACLGSNLVRRLVRKVELDGDVCFFCLILQKHFFLANFVPKIKIAYLVLA